MEQYWMPKKLDFVNLRLCIDNYTPDHLFIRDCGGVRENGKYEVAGRAKVVQPMAGKTLNFRKNKSGLYMIVDDIDVFHFPLKDYSKGFSLAYERFDRTRGYPIMLFSSTGVDPCDPSLPEPDRSILRTVIDDHLMEIYFKGRVHLKFHSWWDKERTDKYWTVDPHPKR